MASDVPVIKPGKYRNNINPSTIVEAVTEAEMRMGEMRGLLQGQEVLRAVGR